MQDEAAVIVSALIVTGALTTWVFLVLRLIMHYKPAPKDPYRQAFDQIVSEQRHHQAKLDELMVRTTAIQRLLEDAD